MQNLNWTEVEARAKTMTDDELRYAIKDCREAAEAMGNEPRFGKDQGYYTDEGSVYAGELRRRAEKAAKAAAKKGARRAPAPAPEDMDPDLIREDDERSAFNDLLDAHANEF